MSKIYVQMCPKAVALRITFFWAIQDLRQEALFSPISVNNASVIHEFLSIHGGKTLPKLLPDRLQTLSSHARPSNRACWTSDARYLLSSSYPSLHSQGAPNLRGPAVSDQRHGNVQSDWHDPVTAEMELTTEMTLSPPKWSCSVKTSKTNPACLHHNIPRYDLIPSSNLDAQWGTTYVITDSAIWGSWQTAVPEGLVFVYSIIWGNGDQTQTTLYTARFKLHLIEHHSSATWGVYLST